MLANKFCNSQQAVLGFFGQSILRVQDIGSNDGPHLLITMNCIGPERWRFLTFLGGKFQRLCDLPEESELNLFVISCSLLSFAIGFVRECLQFDLPNYQKIGPAALRVRARDFRQPY
jgi:hypothetical protein